MSFQQFFDCELVGTNINKTKFMIKQVAYKTICKWIRDTRENPATPIKIPTLGGKSYFYIWCFADRILTTRRGKNEYIYYPEMWAKVIDHMKTLDNNQREVGRYYVRPFWKDCPDNITAPGVPAICKEYWRQKQVM